MINWDFLMEALVGFGFPQQYCAWIKQCVSTTTYSISLNGGIYGFFGGKRGLRQGDPLSPLLFGLCVEVLSRRIKDISELPTFHYHPRCKEVGLTHLIYADDLMLFARGDESSLKLFAECLEKFGNEAGLRANPIKSQLYMAGISATTKVELLGIMGFQEGVFPFRYLGIPLAAEKLRIANYGPLLDTISRKMKRWPRQTLSYAGKLELVQTVIQGTECYWFSMLPIPGGVIDKIKAMCRLFVWNSKYPPIAWDTISMPKENGGYGLKNLNVWNKALLTKVLWDIKSRADTIWSKWVHQHYVKGVDFWEWEATSLDSPLIKRLVEIKEEIKCNANGVGEANMMFMDWFIMKKKGVSKAYEFFQGTHQTPPWVPMLWRSEIMPKHRFIMWLLSHRKLRTADRMSYEANKECPICKQREETMDHLFFKCPFAHALWEKVKQWLDIKFRFNKIEELLNGVRRRYRGAGNKVKARFLGISSVIYHIWTTQNKCKIEGVPPSIEGSFRKVQIHVHRFVNLIDAG